ncbi:MAG: 2-oxoacid:acceptor oxidoreductase family protein [Coriobacteriales bacterium]|jgi:2-oxoglutarate ferredoxin oxidoreductase subunit gamma|nr:2-oxoacid:acceptor oxidoreductase family protein [Coriobacteriales bacterium]
MTQEYRDLSEAKELSILLAGFGGQGILFAGKLVAYAGLLDGREVSWLPSYGPEMRGGTANCSVCLSDSPIGSPLVTDPDVLVAFNRPSYDSFIDKVKPGGLVLVDKSMIDVCPLRADIRFEGIEATRLAEDNELSGLGNVVAVGKLLQLTGFSTVPQVEIAIEKSVSAKHIDLLEFNKQALALGFAHQSEADCAR